MAFEKTVPEWSAVGTEPPDSLKTSGFTAGYKPPAAYFNWFWNGVSEALSELQSGAVAHKQVLEAGTDLDTVTVSGFYRIQSGHDNAPDGSDYGQLLVLHGGGDTIAQILVSYKDASCWVRSGSPTDVSGSGSWSDWSKLSTTDEAPAHIVYARYSLASTDGGTELDDLLETVLSDMEERNMRHIAVHDANGYSALGGGTSFITLHKYNDSYAVVSAYRYGSIPHSVRVKSTGTWGDWLSVYTTGNKPTPADIGAATVAAVEAAQATADEAKSLAGSAGGGDTVTFTQSLTSGTAVGTLSINGTETILYAPTDTNTKNTAGSSNTSSKIYLIGATSQATDPQTYSHDTAYVGTDGCLYSNSTKVSVEGHTQAASTITTGTFPTTAIYAKTGTDYTTARARNIKASTTDLTAGSSSLSSGDIYLVYE